MYILEENLMLGEIEMWWFGECFLKGIKFRRGGSVFKL